MAQRIGLVHETCPATELEAAGARFVDHLLLAGPEAVAITKRLVAESAQTPFTAAFHDRIVDAAAQRRRSAEAAEGLASFRDKRRPRWYAGD
jgi:methylglutaconyl-CoA hydratase